MVDPDQVTIYTWGQRHPRYYLAATLATSRHTQATHTHAHTQLRPVFELTALALSLALHHTAPLVIALALHRASRLDESALHPLRAFDCAQAPTGSVRVRHGARPMGRASCNCVRLAVVVLAVLLSCVVGATTSLSSGPQESSFVGSVACLTLKEHYILVQECRANARRMKRYEHVASCFDKKLAELTESAATKIHEEVLTCIGQGKILDALRNCVLQNDPEDIPGTTPVLAPPTRRTTANTGTASASKPNDSVVMSTSLRQKEPTRVDSMEPTRRAIASSIRKADLYPMDTAMTEREPLELVLGITERRSSRKRRSSFLPNQRRWRKCGRQFFCCLIASKLRSLMIRCFRDNCLQWDPSC